MTLEFSNLTVISKTKGKLPRLPFLKLKEAVLGKAYELSVAFVGSSRSRALNRQYRKKDNPANVLSFPLTKKSGEIYLDLAEIKKWDGEAERSGGHLVGFFLIHGLLHLKGMKHGSKMESTEKRLLTRFLI